MDHDRPPGARVLTWVAALCSLALFLPLTWPLAHGRVFVFDDLANFHLPVRYLYARALQAGDSILWTPALFAGFYLHGEGQVGMLHPLHLLLYEVLPLGIAFNLELLSSYAIAFAGMRYFLRRLALSHGASLAGAMLFAFGGFQLLHFHHLNVVAIVAHLPWLLASLDVLITADTPRQRAGGYTAVALVLASAVLLGFPQAVWWNLLAGGGFAIFHARERARLRRLVACAAAALTGIMIGAVQLLPTLDVAAHSTRAHPVDSAFALTYSLHPYNVLQLWSPYALQNRIYASGEYAMLHEFGIYAGALALVAPLWLWIRRGATPQFRRLAAAAAVFAAVMFVLALGRYGLLDLLLIKLPGLSALRAPARYIVLVQFALAIVSALALEDLATLPAGGVRLARGAVFLLCVPALLSIATTLTFNTGMLTLPGGLAPAPLLQAVGGTVIVAAVTAAFFVSSRTRVAVPLLVVLTALDLGGWGLSYVWRTRPRTLAWLTTPGPPPIPGFRYDWSDEWHDGPVLKGHHLARGYAGLFPATRLRPDSQDFQRLAGVRAFVRADGSVKPLTGAASRVTLTGEPAAAVLVGDRPGRMAIRTMADRPQLLSLTERFDPGWTATIDGAVVAVVPLRGDFLSCPVPAGTHRIEFRFRPRSFVLGMQVSAAGAVLLVLGALVMRRARRGVDFEKTGL